MKFVSLFLLLICSSNSFCQNEYKDIFGDSTKKIEWTCSIAYLPSPQSESVVLEARPSGIVARHSMYKIRKFYRRKKTRRIRLKKEDFQKMYDRYTSLNQRYVDFPISENDRDSLRKFITDSSFYGDPVYKVKADLLEKYLEKDTIKMDMSVFAMDSLNDIMYGMVIDGAPFRFRNMSISSEKDTAMSIYDGNLFGGAGLSGLISLIKQGNSRFC